MSDPPSLPAEMLDHVVDHLCDQTHALRNCCLVSKSWIPRTRKHLFAKIIFHTMKSLQSWKRTFPDPSASPAHYTTNLFIDYSHAVTFTETEADRWIKGFSRVEHLWLMAGHGDGSLAHGTAVSLVTFLGLSPFVKSLCTTFVPIPSQHVFDIILSFPLLEDLAVTTFCEAFTDNGNGPDKQSKIDLPSNMPMFTGSLELFLRGGMKHIASWLLSLPGGIRFRKLTLTWCHEEDLSMTAALVEGCSCTLKSLDVTHNVHFQPGPASVNLSKAAGLEDVAFRVRSRNVEWITTVLQTITPGHQHLREITIHLYFDFTISKVGPPIRQIIGEQAFGQWLELDRLLVRFWESCSIRSEVIWVAPKVGEQIMRDCIGCLLPMLTMTRGLIDLVE